MPRLDCGSKSGDVGVALSRGLFRSSAFAFVNLVGGDRIVYI